MMKTNFPLPTGWTLKAFHEKVWCERWVVYAVDAIGSHRGITGFGPTKAKAIDDFRALNNL